MLVCAEKNQYHFSLAGKICLLQDIPTKAMHCNACSLLDVLGESNLQQGGNKTEICGTKQWSFLHIRTEKIKKSVGYIFSLSAISSLRKILRKVSATNLSRGQIAVNVCSW